MSPRKRPGEPSVAGTVIQTRVDPKAPAFQKNSRDMIDRVAEIKNDEEKIREGGGAKAIEASQKKSANCSRANRQADRPGDEFFELGVYAAFEMYAEWGARRRREPSRDWQTLPDAG